VKKQTLNAQRPTPNSAAAESAKTNQAATDAKQRPGFQTRHRGNGISEIEGKGREGSADDSGEEQVSIEECDF
jgi:hypothetical protein